MFLSCWNLFLLPLFFLIKEIKKRERESNKVEAEKVLE
jgi:hypothetical protein